MGKAGFVGMLGALFVGVVIACKIYTEGFFLTRYELKHHSQGPVTVSPQYDKVVILLVDALRYDFAEAISSPDPPKFYQNRLRVLEEKLRTEPEHSWLFRLEADPPTVTMQRIKGITTGSLPTFIDFKDNFHSNAVEEDNLIWQCRNHTKRAIFIGDDTWLSLFPNDFAATYPFDSFNVKDLDTVDRGVMQHLPREMRAENWTVIIGHMLGVDHVGHRYYADHPEMKRKLDEVNEFIGQLIIELPSSALLLVFGDHGMTDDGNHGGTSSQETNSVLFAYSKRPFAFKTKEFPLGTTRSLLYQIDLVPTLSLVLGLPIPFNNLGTVILELFQAPGEAVNALYANAAQVFTYLRTYDSEVQRLPDSQFEDLQNEFMLLRQQYAEDPTRSDLPRRLAAFVRASGEMCRGIWTTFDIGAMEWGATLLGGTVVLMGLCAVWSPKEAKAGWSLGVLGVYWGLGPGWGTCAAFVVWILAEKRSTHTSSSSDLLISFSLQVLLSYCKFSNSYILKEDSAVRFLLLLLLWRCYSSSVNRSSQWKTYLACAALVRLSAALDPISQKEQLQALTWIDSLLMSSFARVYAPLAFLWRISQKSRCSPGHKAATTVSFLLVCGYWALHDFPLFPSVSDQLKLLLPRAVYLISAVSIVCANAEGVYVALQPVLCLVGGAEFPVVMATIGAQVVLFEKVMKGRRSELVPLFYYLACWQMFYSSGHRCSFPSLQIASAFTGLASFNLYLSGCLLTLNTFSCLILLLRPYISSPTPEQQQWVTLHIVTSAAIGMLMTTGNTMINRRHLMVWPIFAPKYIFDLAVTAGAFGVSIIMAIAFGHGEEKKRAE